MGFLLIVSGFGTGHREMSRFILDPKDQTGFIIVWVVCFGCVVLYKVGFVVFLLLFFCW